MTPFTLGPWALETATGTIPDLDDRLPRPNSLRRASEESKTSVLVASKVLEAWPKDRRDRLGVYVAQQRGGLEYVTQFIDTSLKEGARFASPLHFSESVANNAATHLSLTFGFTGVVSTFIGSRIAGIQALVAACEDLETGGTDGALVVVQSFPNRLTSDAYTSLYAPGRRRPPVAPLPMLSGSLAFLVRKGETEGLRLLFAGIRCAGRSSDAKRRAVESLWKESGADFPAEASMLCLDRPHAGKAISEVFGDALPSDAPAEERFPLDPFLRLFRSPTEGPRAVVTVSEEGAAGLIAVAGPGPGVERAGRL